MDNNQFTTREADANYDKEIKDAIKHAEDRIFDWTGEYTAEEIKAKVINELEEDFAVLSEADREGVINQVFN